MGVVGEAVDTWVVATEENTVEVEAAGQELAAVAAKVSKTGSMAEGFRDIMNCVADERIGTEGKRDILGWIDDEEDEVVVSRDCEDVEGCVDKVMARGVLEERDGGGRVLSASSKTEDSREHNSEAFLFVLEIGGGRDGVPLQECCLWQVVWKVDLQAKHFTGLAGFLITLEQRGQLRLGGTSLPTLELVKLLARTALLKAEMSWPLALPSLVKRPRRRFFTNQTAATEPSLRMLLPWTCTILVVWCR